VNLQGLFLSNNQIKDVDGLKSLVNLRNLNMADNQLGSLDPLSALVNLTQLNSAENRIQDLQPLQGLSKLQKLNLSYNRIEDISPLSALFCLRKLDLAGNWISDVSSLQWLVSLRELVLARNQIRRIDEDWLDTFPTLQDLFLMENNIANLPIEIYSHSNCLYNVKNFFKDKAKGTIPVYEAKLILVGNGRVGKTSLVNRLLDNSFNPEEPSTHAIQLREWELPALAEETGIQKLKVNIWDFGGQDIYHATHRLFMNAKALFVLVWDQQTLIETSQKEVLLSGRVLHFQNHALQYWLSYIKSLSGGSPVLVVQSKMGENGKKSPPLTDEEKRKYNVRDTLSIDSGLLAANGFRSLRSSVEEVLTEQIQNAYTEIPSQWYAVRENVATLQTQQVQRLPMEEFKRICKEKGLDDSSVNTLLGYLHNTGVFFYRDGLFGNQIVLDQRWVIDAVYALFDRKGSFSRMHSNGMFSGLDLLEMWEDKTSEERKLFLSFMVECEICFEVKSSANADEGIDFSERVFIAPQLLPERKPKAIEFAFDGHDEVYFKYQHYFLHGAVIQRLIVRLGFSAELHEIWQQGILIRTKAGIALVESIPDRGQLLVRIKAPDYREILRMIEKQLTEINADEEGISISVSLDGTTFVSLESINRQPPENERIQSEDGRWVNFRDYERFDPAAMSVFKQSLQEAKIRGVEKRSLPTIFFSYAWGADREKVVDDLYNRLINDGYQVVRDKNDLGYKGLISDFMKGVGKGNIVVVAISDKYLRSPFCMYELYEIYRNAKLEKEELLKIILPVRVENLNLADPDVLKGYFEYWTALEGKWKGLVNEYGADQNEHRKIESIKNALRDLLPFLNYINTLTIELLTANDFQVIKEAIKARVTEMHHL
jgi:small GTP-binding protein